MKQFWKKISDHITDRITNVTAINEGTCKLNISTTYLSRIVKRITGRTVYSHISELICVEAKRLLECSDKDVKEISDWLGFSDQSVFGKFFLKRTGLSPMKYRTMRLGN